MLTTDADDNKLMQERVSSIPWETSIAGTELPLGLSERTRRGNHLSPFLHLLYL